MADDEREEEREFLERLKARTGRSLAEWMAAIAAQGFSDKNEIIDWLRAQGLPFARASWLERIHRNGGRPIHLDAADIPDTPDERPADRSGSDPWPPASAIQRQRGDQGSDPDAAALDKLLAAAKGYRPLYQLIEAEVRNAIPGAAFLPKGRYICVVAPSEFAAITLHATEIRLGLALGDHPIGGRLEKAKLRGPGPANTHKVVLTDARQRPRELLTGVKAPALRALDLIFDQSVRSGRGRNANAFPETEAAAEVIRDLSPSLLAHPSNFGPHLRVTASRPPPLPRGSRAVSGRGGRGRCGARRTPGARSRAGFASPHGPLGLPAPAPPPD
jgi:hypothetical protein